MRGNVDGLPDDNVDISDLTALIGYLFITFDPNSICPEEADIDGSTPGTEVDISDLTSMINYLFIALGDPLPSCFDTR